VFWLTEDLCCRVVTAAHTVIDTKEIRARNGMENTSLVLRLGGRAVITVGEETYDSAQDHVTLIPQNTPYTAHYEQNELYFVHFSTNVPLCDRPLDRRLYCAERVRGLFGKLVETCERRVFGFQVEANALLMQILVECARDGQEENAIYRTVYAIMQAEYGDISLSIEGIAARVGVSPSQLRRLFRASGGVSPRRCLNEIRLDHAARLLANERVSVAEVAVRCGFSDARYFARVCKQHRRCTPRQLRLP